MFCFRLMLHCDNLPNEIYKDNFEHVQTNTKEMKWNKAYTGYKL